MEGVGVALNVVPEVLVAQKRLLDFLCALGQTLWARCHNQARSWQ